LSLAIALVVLGPSLFVAFAVLAIFTRVVAVIGSSMEPTFRHGDILIALRRLHFLPVWRGAVVLVRGDPHGRMWLKRAVAVSGDEYVSRLTDFSDPYWRAHYRQRFDANGRQVTSVQPGEIFIRGDSPSAIDSALLGTIPISRVCGIIVLRLSRRRGSRAVQSLSTYHRTRDSGDPGIPL
jgi:Signal peptidase, peptidase S26